MEQQLTPEYIRTHIEIYPLEDGGVKHLYRDTEGSVESVSYELYPGVHLIFKEVHRPQIDCPRALVIGSPIRFPNYKLPGLLLDAGIALCGWVDEATGLSSGLSCGACGNPMVNVFLTGYLFAHTGRLRQALSACRTPLFSKKWQQGAVSLRKRDSPFCHLSFL